MKGILPDINIQGQVQGLLYIWQSNEWRPLWESMQLSVRSFAELELAADTPDDVLWHLCQQREIVLITANRNDEAPNSLEATIRNHNRENCLPVFTIGDAQRVQHDPAYARRVAEELLDYFFTIDRVRGTGRMYVP